MESGATGLICWAPNLPASSVATRTRKPIRFIRRKIKSNLRDLILRKHIVFAVILLCCARAEAQQDEPVDCREVDSLLSRLAAAQIRHDGMFLAGTFPTLRSWAATPGDLKGRQFDFFHGSSSFLRSPESTGALPEPGGAHSLRQHPRAPSGPSPIMPTVTEGPRIISGPATGPFFFRTRGCWAYSRSPNELRTTWMIRVYFGCAWTCRTAPRES